MKIAIVNDMLLAVEAMRRVVHASRRHQVAWIAHDGAEAVAHCARERPDLILMDLLMPIMDGVEATRQIMAVTPCPIVVVTASVDARSSKVFEAMGAGALDAVNTPVIENPGNPIGMQALLTKIDTVEKLLLGRAPAETPSQLPALRHVPRGGDKLVAIGASAGGPAALARMLGSLPADFPAALVIVQHVDAQFTQGLARWLDGQTRLRIAVAHERDRPLPGTALLAGREQHLVFSSAGRLSYTRLPEKSTYRPSVDVFLKSVALHWPGEAVGVLLTGMGRDGAEGLLAMRDRGWHTIAQDQTTSTVYGMPKAAVELRAASEILPMEKIGPRLLRWAAHKTHSHV